MEHFWRQVENWLSNITASKVKLTVLEVLLGFLNFDSDFYYAINYVIIIAKFYLNKAKKNGKQIFFLYFLYTLRDKLILEEKVYIKQDRSKVFSDIG